MGIHALWAEAKRFLNNPNLKVTEIHEWSSAYRLPQDDEICIKLPDSGMYVCVPEKADKRVAKD